MKSFKAVSVVVAAAAAMVAGQAVALERASAPVTDANEMGGEAIALVFAALAIVVYAVGDDDDEPVSA